MEKRKFFTKRQLVGFVGTALFSFGLILLVSNFHIHNLLLSKIFILQPGSMIVDDWLKTPFELKTNIYFFNWTNPEEFHNLSIKPKLNQVGPYTFSLRNEKANVVWNDNNTVTYNTLRFWNVDESQKNLTDKITIFNSISLFVADYIKNWNYLTKRVISSVIDKVAPDLYVTKTALEFIINGYYDIFVDLANYLPFIASDVPRYEKFGFLRVMNGTTTFSGLYNMANGANGNFDLLNWNYLNATPFYDKECSKVHGSASELYSRKQSKSYTGIFLPELCRYIKFDFEKIVHVHGVLGYKYVLGKNVLDNGSLVSENKCYCNGKCLPYGMLNISACRFNLPTFISLPNFYQADPVYLNDFEGLHPNREEHEVYVVLEPKTSALLEINLKFQLNVLVRPVEGLDTYQHLRTVFFPIMWIEQKTTLPESQASVLQILIKFPTITASVGIVIMLVASVLIFFAYRALIVGIIGNHKRNKGKIEKTKD